jgi:hypothetical protein
MKVALFCKPSPREGGRSDLVEFMRGEVLVDQTQLNDLLTLEDFFKIETSTGPLWVRGASVDAFRVLP